MAPEKEMMGTEPAAVAAAAECEAPEPGKTAEKKKKKRVTVRLSQDRIDRILAIPPRTRPFPVLSEKVLATIKPCPVEREKYRAMMAEAAARVYKSREDVKREQDHVREELAALGYVEREIEVTDGEGEEDGDDA